MNWSINFWSENVFLLFYFLFDWRFKTPSIQIIFHFSFFSNLLRTICQRNERFLGILFPFFRIRKTFFALSVMILCENWSVVCLLMKFIRKLAEEKGIRIENTMCKAFWGDLRRTLVVKSSRGIDMDDLLVLKAFCLIFGTDSTGFGSF